MKKNIIPVLILSISLIASCNEKRLNEQPTMATVSAGKEAKIDAEEFLKKAYKGNMKEVELGKMAKEKASNREVKKFAQMIVNEHDNANKKLIDIAENKNVTLPDSLDADAKKTMANLQNMSGLEFDKSYMDLIVKEHKKSIDLYSSAINDIQDKQINKYAKNTLNHIQEHLNQAENINKMLEEMPTAKGK